MSQAEEDFEFEHWWSYYRNSTELIVWMFMAWAICWITSTTLSWGVLFGMVLLGFVYDYGKYRWDHRRVKPHA